MNKAEPHLRQRNAGRYQFAIAVPRDLYGHFKTSTGTVRKAFEVALKTDDLSVARVHRAYLLEEYLGKFARARADLAVNAAKEGKPPHEISAADLARLSHQEAREFHERLGTQYHLSKADKQNLAFMELEKTDEELGAWMQTEGVEPTPQALALYREMRWQYLEGAKNLDLQGKPFPDLKKPNFVAGA